NLAAVCVPRLDKIVSQTGKLTDSQVSLIDLGMSPSARQTLGRDSLLDKIRCDIDLAPLLDGIYIADSLEQALAVRGDLTARESIVTHAGAWVGRNWLSHG